MSPITCIVRSVASSLPLRPPWERRPVGCGLAIPIALLRSTVLRVENPRAEREHSPSEHEAGVNPICEIFLVAIAGVGGQEADLFAAFGNFDIEPPGRFRD